MELDCSGRLHTPLNTQKQSNKIIIKKKDTKQSQVISTTRRHIRPVKKKKRKWGNTSQSKHHLKFSKKVTPVVDEFVTSGYFLCPDCYDDKI